MFFFLFIGPNCTRRLQPLWYRFKVNVKFKKGLSQGEETGWGFLVLVLLHFGDWRLEATSSRAQITISSLRKSILYFSVKNLISETVYQV